MPPNKQQEELANTFILKVNINLTSLVTGKLILLSWDFHFPAPSHQKEKEKSLRNHKFSYFWAHWYQKKNLKSLFIFGSSNLPNSASGKTEDKVNQTVHMSGLVHETEWGAWASASLFLQVISRLTAEQGPTIINISISCLLLCSSPPPACTSHAPGKN